VKRPLPAIICLLFVFLTMLFCSESNKVVQKELEPVDLSNINQFELLYKLGKVESTPKREEDMIVTNDLNFDGNNEYVRIANSVLKTGQNPFIDLGTLNPNRIINSLTYNNRVSQPNFFDITEDRKNEIFYCEINEDSTICHIINHECDSVLSFLGVKNPKTSTRKWNCVIELVGLMDVNNDNHKDLILTVDTDRAYQPRGIYTYDFHNNKFIIKYKTGFVIRNVHLYDIDNDGQDEIIFGSSAPDNCQGSEVNGTDDTASYITILNSNLEKIKHVKHGNVFSAMNLYKHDLTNDLKPEFIVAFKSGNDRPENGYIGLLNIHSLDIAPKRPFPTNPNGMLNFLDADLDGNDDIIVGWDDGKVEIVNDKLELVYSRKFPNFKPANILVNDFNNNGNKEIILSGNYFGTQVILVLNRQLKLLAYLTGYQLSHQIVKTDFGKNKWILAWDKTNAVFFNLKKQHPIFFKIFWKWIGYGFFIGVILIGTFSAIFVSRRNLKTTELVLNTTINSVPYGLLVLDLRGKIISANQMSEQIFNIDRTNLLNQFYEDVFSDSNFYELNQTIKYALNDNTSHEKEINILQGNSSRMFLFCNGQLTLKKRKHLFVSLQDITDIIQSKRTIAWATMAQKLAHEIKTPLSTVMLSAQRLQMEYEQKPKEMKKVEKYLNNITGQVDRLRKVTDAFMKFVKMEKSKIEPIKINQLISNCLEEMQIKMSKEIKTNKELAADIPTFKADGQQLSIALKNIFDNSLNAMKNKGTITVTTRLVQSLQTQNSNNLKNSIQIEIADTGIGIPKEFMNELFQPFFSKSPGGTGLGLVITKKIIEDHEGKIKIVSEEGIGTTVFVTLPV
jgi:signal transduction histidine kinase